MMSCACIPTLCMRGPSMSLREAWPAPRLLKDTIIFTTRGLPDTMSLRRSTLHLHHTENNWLQRHNNGAQSGMVMMSGSGEVMMKILQYHLIITHHSRKFANSEAQCISTMQVTPYNILFIYRFLNCCTIRPLSHEATSGHHCLPQCERAGKLQAISDLHQLVMFPLHDCQLREWHQTRRFSLLCWSRKRSDTLKGEECMSMIFYYLGWTCQGEDFLIFISFV